MKATGIVRKIDQLGRIVIPIEQRRLLNIDISDPAEIYVDGDFIILKKHVPYCYLCDSAEGLKQYLGKNVCQDCIDSL